MNRPLICMTLTGKTLEENHFIVKKYEKQVDIVELRVDHLDENEQFLIKRFPSMISKPCVLTIRRSIDGGKFSGSDFSRTNLFGRALAFANPEKSKNFAYVDFEDDYFVPSLQDAAVAFGVKIIRSHHNMTGPIFNLRDMCEKMRKTSYEIPKISFMPHSLSDVKNIFLEGKKLTEMEHIFCAMGVQGFPSRVLANHSNSYLSYVSPDEMLENVNSIGHTDPLTLSDLYSFRSIDFNTDLFGIIGWPLQKTLSPTIHNFGYKKFKLNSIYIPIPSKTISEALSFCNYLNFKGLSVTVPHKEDIIFYLQEQSFEVAQIGACNTIVRKNNHWIGYNTDAYGFRRALEEFLNGEKIKRKKVAVIGAGGAAKAVVFALKQMGAKVCIFNRTIEKAEQLADQYGFQFCQLDSHCIEKLDEFSNLIIQTTTVGMNDENESSIENDPLYFYDFRGNEQIFDLIYTPSITPLMKRAETFGCKTCNGYKMLEYQAYAQFKLFTGLNYEEMEF